MARFNNDSTRFTDLIPRPENGIFTQHWPNGNLRYEWHYANRKRVDGISKGWFENGVLKQTQAWKNNRKNGPHIQWFDTGQKKRERMFVDGRVNGKCLEWYGSGELKREGYYTDDKKTGKWVVWHRDGQIKRISQTIFTSCR